MATSNSRRIVYETETACQDLEGRLFTGMR